MSAYDESLKSRVCPLSRLAMSRQMSHNYKLLLYKVNIDKFSKYKQSYENSSKGSSYLTVNKEVFMEKSGDQGYQSELSNYCRPDMGISVRS